jgi:cytochrome c-type biogenesis protein
VSVDLEKGEASVSCDPSLVDRDALSRKVEDVGYRVSAETASKSGIKDTDSRRRLVLYIGIGLAVVILGALAFRYAQNLYLSPGSIGNLIDLFATISPVSLGLAFLFGLAVAFAPSTYAMAPAVMGYVTGAKQSSRLGAMKLSLGFVAGLATVDMVIGALFAAGGAIAIQAISSRLPLWYAIITITLVLMALIVLRVWRPRFPAFIPKMRQVRSFTGAYFLGVPFGLMACPVCTPLLLPLALGAAATGQPLYGAALMGAFAIGRGIPLTILGTYTAAFQKMGGTRSYVPWVERVVGILLLAGAGWFFWQFLQVGGVFGLF